MEGTLGAVLVNVVSSALVQVGSYLPQFFGGIIILAIGLLVAAILHRLVVEFFKLVKIDKVFEEAKIAKASSVRVWPEIFGELVRWAVIILFLVPAAEAWGIPKVTEVLSRLLLYIPNVFVAVIVGLVGLVVANIVHDVVRHGAKGLGSQSSHLLAAFARYTILFFTGLIVLNQLGVAADLVRILFTGIVAMVAIAGGLAFGLGGQDVARDILKVLRKRFEGK